jgi:catechol 2,3-dioxygenase-like lactoylglutathione lyase family enzyme
MIQLKHIALGSSSEEKSDRFYSNLLGMEKINSKVLPQTLSRQIFDSDAEFKIINYANEQIHFEIFIPGTRASNHDAIEHICLGVDNLQALLAKCRDLEVKIRQVPRGDALITFISDYDGNLFELKPQ